jgi:hypothetical protein
MLTYGFYNSLNGDRKYDAIQLSSIFDGIITDGVFKSIGTSFAVTASTGRVVVVGIGRAWFNHTWTLNDAPFQLTLDASDPILHRIDTVVLQVDTRAANRVNSIYIVKGTPASTPIAPVLIETGDHIQYPIANIYLAAQATTILQANITSLIGTVDFPYVNVIDAETQIGTRNYTEQNYVTDYESLTDSVDKLDIGIKTEVVALQQRATNIEAITTPIGNLIASKALATNAQGDIVVSAVTAAELAHLVGVTSPIQTQLNAVVEPTKTANKALITNASGKIAVSTASAAEVAHLVGVTSPIQTQLNSIIGTTLVANRVLISDANAKIAVSLITPTELEYLSGLTSNVQAQLNATSSSITGGASSIVVNNLTVNRALISDSLGKVAVSPVSSTQLGYLSDLTSAIQAQLNAKQAAIIGAATTILSSNLAANKALLSDASGKVAASAVTNVELGYLAGVNQAIQTQFGGKLDTGAQAIDSLKVGGKKLTVSTTAPASPAVGDLWVDTN